MTAPAIDPNIRIYIIGKDGMPHDAKHDCSLSEFAGVLPSVGDVILYSGVVSGLDRSKPDHRDMWEVVKRIFNPRDLPDYIALVVKERAVQADEVMFVS